MANLATRELHQGREEPMKKRGAQIARQRFTGSEDLALLAIVKGEKRVNWAKVAKALHERGFPQRTPKSVRNRNLRWRQAQNGVNQQQKNFCRKCGRPQRGHVCEVIEVVTPPAEAEP